MPISFGIVQLSVGIPTWDEVCGGVLSVDDGLDEETGGDEDCVTVTIDVAVTVDVETGVGEPPQPTSDATSTPPIRAPLDTFAIFLNNVSPSPAWNSCRQKRKNHIGLQYLATQLNALISGLTQTTAT